VKITLTLADAANHVRLRRDVECEDRHPSSVRENWELERDLEAPVAIEIPDRAPPGV
jgi:hypothetical protein